MYQIHHDEALFPAADIYQPFRFVLPEKQENAGGKRKPLNPNSDASAKEEQRTYDLEENARIIREKRLSMVTTSENYLPFGHGKHAWYNPFFLQCPLSLCMANAFTSSPGRFFAANEIKLLIAYVMLHYEIEALPELPPNKWIDDNVLAHTDVQVNIRRRIV